MKYVQAMDGTEIEWVYSDLRKHLKKVQDQDLGS